MRFSISSRSVLCPKCGDSNISLLQYCSALAWVYWFRCLSCFFVWSTDKTAGPLVDGLEGAGGVGARRLPLSTMR